MEVVSQSADKAVSTEDLCVVTRDINLEVARLEAMLNTLVENKVEAMKADKTKSCSDQSTPRTLDKRLQRITSSSTASSSHKDRCHRRRHHGYRDHDHARRIHGRRHGHSRCRMSSTSPESPRVRASGAMGALGAVGGVGQRRGIPRPCCEHSLVPAPLQQPSSDEEDDEEANETFDFLAYADHRTFVAVCDPDATPCSCPDNHNGQIKLPYDDDYVSINIEDFENVEEDAIITHDALRRARRKRRKRRKKRRKKLQRQQLAIAAASAVTVREKVKVIDPDDLPQRARWTIVATACLLLLMCLLLVGVTLRMAPIIDDMVRKENEELMNSLNRESSYNSSYTAHVAHAAPL